MTKILFNEYCEIFSTPSYGGDALASSCVLRHMNSCRISHNINSITYNHKEVTLEHKLFARGTTELYTQSDCRLHTPSVLADRPIMVSVLQSIKLLSVLNKHLVID